MATDAEGGSVTPFRHRRGWLVTGIVLVLALFTARPGAQRLQTRIVQSVSLALGRQVEVGSVRLRLLPQPGFELETFVVHDNPAFGAEPVLRSSHVLALLRMSSVLRARLEIARLSLTEPSLNLVRNPGGRWNLEDVIERAVIAPAVSGRTRSGMRPAFPYIEADHGRINFKFGAEKKPYSLIEANFALWQDTNNAWGVRMKAQPMRTDFNLSDTGVLEVDGSWQRAATLRETPVRFTAHWEGAQLGQVTKLALGQDKGWRGAIALSTSITGTPQNLTVAAEASIQDFRRYDIASDTGFRLAAQCGGHYSSSDRLISRLACRAPVGDGGFALNGTASGSGVYDLTLLATRVPVQPLVELARRVKTNIPAGIVAAGRLDAELTLQRDPASGASLWQGGGAIVDLNLRSALNNLKLAVERIPFAVSSTGDLELSAVSERKLGRVKVVPRAARHDPAAFAPHLNVAPFSLALGRSADATVDGQISRSGYSFAIQGDVEVQRFFDLARTVGLNTPPVAANGEAHLNLNARGIWAGFGPPVVTGTALLSSVHAQLRILKDPVEIAFAHLSLTPETAEVRRLSAAAAGNKWQGWLSVPRQCDAAGDCPIRFDLRSEELITDAVGAAFTGLGKQPWYRALSLRAQSSPAKTSSQLSPSDRTSTDKSSPRATSAERFPSARSRPYLASVHAIGKLAVGRVLIHNLVANRVSADVELNQGRLRLSNLRGEIMGGRHLGEWAADFSVSPPTYSGNGSLDQVALGQLAEAMHDGWITGTANATYRANTLGWSAAELFSGAAASLHIEMRDGSLPHLILTGEDSSLRINRFSGRLQLRDGKFNLEEGKLQTPAGIYLLSGTASLGRALNFRMARDGFRGFAITGTLAQPKVSTISTPDTQAALKP